MDPNAFLQQGDLIQDWDAFEHVYQTSFDVPRVRDPLKHSSGGKPTSETIKSSMGEGKCPHPLLIVDSGCTHSVDGDADAQVKQRMKITEICMETLDASAMLVAPTPMLAAFSYGRQTGTVVDTGAGGYRVTPIVDGLLLKSAQRPNRRGGDWLGNVQWEGLLQEKVTVQP